MKDYNALYTFCKLHLVRRHKRENSVYAKRKAELKPIVEEIFHKSRETYGSSKIIAIMKDRGYAISEKTVADIMHRYHLDKIRQVGSDYF